MLKILRKIYAVLILACILPSVIGFVQYMGGPEAKPVLVNNVFWDMFIIILLCELGLATVVSVIYSAIICLKND